MRKILFAPHKEKKVEFQIAASKFFNKFLALKNIFIKEFSTDVM